MSEPEITASVQHIAAPAPPEGLQWLAEAALCSYAPAELNAALRLAANVRSHYTQHQSQLRRDADELRLQLTQIEQQLAGYPR